MTIKRIVKSIPVLYKWSIYLRDFINLIRPNSKYKFSGGGVCYKTKIRVRGDNNSIIVGLGSSIRESSIVINGNNNLIEVGENCHIGRYTDILIEGNNHLLKIGANSTFTEYVHLCLQEHNTKMILGVDSMLSNHIIIRTSDSHPIYKDGCRINYAADVIVGNHVWVCPNSTIMKGVSIGDNVIIASNAMVTSNVESNVMIGGIPAKVINRNCQWTREILW